MSTKQNDEFYEHQKEMEEETMTFIREQYATPHEMRTWEDMGFIVEQVKPIKMNARGYLVRLYGKGK